MPEAPSRCSAPSGTIPGKVRQRPDEVSRSLRRRSIGRVDAWANVRSARARARAARCASEIGGGQASAVGNRCSIALAATRGPNSAQAAGDRARGRDRDLLPEESPHADLEWIPSPCETEPGARNDASEYRVLAKMCSDPRRVGGQIEHARRALGHPARRTVRKRWRERQLRRRISGVGPDLEHAADAVHLDAADVGRRARMLHSGDRAAAEEFEQRRRCKRRPSESSRPMDMVEMMTSRSVD